MGVSRRVDSSPGRRYLGAVERSGGLERSDLKMSRPLLAHELLDSQVMSNHGVSPPPRPSTGGMCSLLPAAMPAQSTAGRWAAWEAAGSSRAPGGLASLLGVPGGLEPPGAP